jgi:hypothetical protein
MYEHHSEPLLPRPEFLKRVAKHAALAVGVVAFSLLLGMVGYVGLAHMRWVDAFLNSAMLLGGMGPVGDLPNDPAKIFAGLYALYAGLIFIVAASVLVAPVAHRIFHRLHLDED